MTAPINPDHFEIRPDGSIAPQPWMQWRHVASVEAASKTGSYAVVGGINKNDLLHKLQLPWQNNSPIPQHCYGLITRGGCRVSLQARSVGYLQVTSGFKLNAPGDAGDLEIASRFGCGADMGRGGTLAVGTEFGIIEERMNSVTFPLAPERAGWPVIEPGDLITARVEVRFVSQQWETTSIDGGTSGSDSSYNSGATRLDLFAVPVI
ncbi:hypothetical protein AVJ28_gp36 [Mycobacterium phage Baee]|uniref:DUF7172 domain-containing protein n=2 Tax=Acadianvirus baee TaxID=1982902 RepID=A0A1L6BYW8_9CAUD|nr:hypothetical protein AVJ28_gp36 [Mycobacterium phage Baee]AKF14605.1 hypothetical protein SEA_BAEE_36 [Mycobacterium phage Baee]APQ42297.1 hypothetical protein PBI_RICH_36 [Mycobacterium phage Rich]